MSESELSNEDERFLDDLFRNVDLSHPEGWRERLHEINGQAEYRQVLASPTANEEQVELEISTVVSMAEFQNRKRLVPQLIFAAASIVFVVVMAAAVLANSSATETVDYTDEPTEETQRVLEDDAPASSVQNTPTPCPTLQIQDLTATPRSENVMVITWLTSTPATETVSLTYPDGVVEQATPSDQFYENFTNELGNPAWSGIQPLEPFTQYSATVLVANECDEDDIVSQSIDFINPAPPSEVACAFSNFRWVDEVWTWSENWTWTVEEQASYEVVVSQDGVSAVVAVGKEGRYLLDPANGLPNSGSSLRELRAIASDGRSAQRSMEGCGASGGIGWTPPDE